MGRARLDGIIKLATERDRELVPGLKNNKSLRESIRDGIRALKERENEALLVEALKEAMVGSRKEDERLVTFSPVRWPRWCLGHGRIN